MPVSLQSSKVPAHQNLLLVHSRTTAQSLKTLQSHSLRANLALTLSMLRAKDMITKLLDGLEMFLGVFVTSLNSSKLQMAGDGIYIGHQVERVVGYFSAWCRIDRWVGTESSGHSVP